MKTNIIIKQSSFPIIMACIALMIVGLAMSPLLKLKLLPDRSLPSVTISYSFNGANAVVVDSELTSKLEGLFSKVEGLAKLRSRTGNGNGTITLEMNKDANMDAVRFEVSTLVRQVYPTLPEGVGYPRISVNRPDEEERVEQLMSFTLNGSGRRWEVGQVAEQLIKPPLSLIDGVFKVGVSGYTPMQWELTYDVELLNNLEITPQEISRQINNYYKSANLGSVVENRGNGLATYRNPVVLTGRSNNKPDWENIKIAANGRFFKLSNLVDIEKCESEPSSYNRINGLNTININVYAAKGANHLLVAAKIKEQIIKIKGELPKNFSINTVTDNTIFLKEELQKILLRISLSLLILILFVWLVSRSRRYMFVITISMAANITIAFIFYHLLGIEIHLYSMAGITISLGIIIDNTIVMADHLRIGKGMSVFRAVLAATLTTAGALIVVLFLDDKQQLMLLDFSYVIIINLGVSVFISLFFVPALLHRFPLPRPSDKRRTKTKRRMVRWYGRYASILFFMSRFRKLVLVVAVLGFGLPIFMLPSNVKGDAWYSNLYNTVFGSQVYGEHIRKVSDKVLGGTLRLFVNETNQKGFSNSSTRTSISVKGAMYEGTTLKQTNEIIKKIEGFLAQYMEIEQFQTSVYGTGNSSIRVYFQKENEFTNFPHTLKAELESMVIDMGVADFKITGVGRGFDNSLNEGRRNSRVTFYGYNLEDLKGYAERFKTYLLDIQRVEAKSIFINGRATRDDRVHKELTVTLNEERLTRSGIFRGQVLGKLRQLSAFETHVANLYNNGNLEKVVLKSRSDLLPDQWEFYNKGLQVGKEKFVKLKNVGKIRKERVTDLINKEDMEYTMVVEFDFIGSSGQKDYLVGMVVEKMANELPLGFRLNSMSNYGGIWGKESKTDNRLLVILLVLAIIYAICAVVFESLVQPFVVLAMIPLSFIGVFLTFYLFDLSFGQGGYASLLLLSGLTVNSALYIINDLNNVRKRSPFLPVMKQYIQAFRQKIVPVFLTIFSTVLGLVPFLYGGQKEAFWFSLAIGTIGGLLFSIFALLVFLPLFMKGIKKKKHKYSL